MRQALRARRERGQVIAAPPSSDMNVRLFTRPPSARASTAAGTTRPRCLGGLEAIATKFGQWGGTASTIGLVDLPSAPRYADHPVRP